jgi:hypothetical protein
LTTENIEAVTPEVEQSTEDTPQEVTDWQAKAKESDEARTALQAELDKVNNDLRSQSGRRNRQQELENLVLQANNTTRLLDRKVDALIRATSGDIDDLPAQLSSIQADQATFDASSAYQSIWTDLSNELVELVQDDDGNSILDIQTAPELEEVREIWTNAHRSEDTRGLQRAMNEAIKVIRRVERQRLKEATTEIKAAAKEDAVNSGAFDLDTGPSAGGSGLSDERWLREVYGSEDSEPTRADHLRAKKILDSL